MERPLLNMFDRRIIRETNSEYRKALLEHLELMKEKRDQSRKFEAVKRRYLDIKFNKYKIN